MRVLFLAPNSREEYLNDKIPLVTPPLNLMYLSQVCMEEGHSVKIIDGYACNQDIDSMSKESLRFHPDIILIPMYSRDLSLVDLLVCGLKKKIPDSIIVVGGHHVSHLPKRVLEEFPDIDYVLRGEGELVLPSFLKLLESGKSVSELDGVVYRDGKQIVVNPSAPAIENIDTIPIPSRKLIVQDRYYSRLSSMNPVDVMVTSRGCPMACSFCSKVDESFRKYRMRSPENVIKEMKQIHKAGVRAIEIYDETFTLDKKRCHQILKLMREEGLRFELRVRTRVDCVDESLIKALKSANCTTISFGVESGNQKILDLNGKGTDLDQIRNAFSLTKRHGINSLGFFLIGFPEDTPETIMQTIEFAKELNPKYATFTRIRPFPGSRLYHSSKDSGTLVGDWHLGEEEPWIKLPWAKSKSDIDAYVNLAYKKYYHRPGFAIRFFADTVLRGNWAQLRYSIENSFRSVRNINLEP